MKKDIKKVLVILIIALFYCSLFGQPTLIPYTPDPTVDLTPTLYWNSVSGATHYKIQIDDDVAFSTTLVDTTISAATTFTPLSPLQNGQIYWRVSSSLDTTLFSTIDDFQIKTYPDLVNPAFNPTTDRSPTLNWSSVSSATSYRIQIDDAVAFSTPDVDTIISAATTLNRYLPGSDTVASQAYYWRVATNYDTTAFSPSGTLNYQEVNISRFNGLIERSSSVTFNWSSYTNATDYRIQVATNPAFTTPLIDTYTSGATTYNATGMGIGTKYWRISTQMNYSSFSRMDSLRISGSPVPVFFNGDTLYTSKPKLVWHKLAGMPSNGSYHIQIDTTRWFTSGMWDGSVYADTNGVVDTTFTPYSNLHDGKWYWRVDSAYMGDYSEIDSFYVKDTTTGWYVRVGASGGNGTKALPFSSLKEGAEYLTNGDTLYISEGVYYGDTVDIYSMDSIVIIGGYNTSFTERDPWIYKSEIDGVDTASQANFTFQKNVTIDGLTFKRFNSNALYMYNRKNIVIKNCIFSDNYTGAYLDRGDKNKIENCIFINNGYGVKLYSWEIADSINLKIKNNTFFNNDSAAIRNDSMGVDVRNNIFAFNKYGYQSKGGKVDTIAYNSFFGNDTLFYNHFYNFKISTIDSLDSDSSYITLSNYNLDPVFIDTSIANLDLHLDTNSSCFDIGDPTSDFSLEPVPNGGRINLGAFGGTQWASTAGELPLVTSSLVNDTIMIGDTLIISITASGTTPLSYQWQKNGVDIAGATSASYVIYGANLADAAIYRAIVSNSFGSDTSNSMSLLVVDNIPPEPVTALTLSEVNCSTVAVSWTPSVSGDAIDVMVRASVISMPTSKDSGEFNQLVLNSVSSLNLTGLPAYGAKLFISTFVKDSIGNWSAYSSTASDTITLSDGEPPENYVTLNLTNSGDTLITINFDVNDTISSDAVSIIYNMNTDSAQIRFSEQDTFAYKDTTFYRSITTQGMYYISWVPVDSSGNVGTMLSDTFTLQNSKPHFVFGDSVVLNEDVEWVMENFVTDYNLDNISVTLISGPSALILDTTINKVIWTPLNIDVGEHLLILSADDMKDGAVIDTLKLIVENVNDVPVIQSIILTDTLIEDSVYSGTLYFKDPDNADTFALNFYGADWITSGDYSYNDVDDIYSFAFKMAPLKSDAGIIDLSIVLSDFNNASDTLQKILYVLSSNYAPEIKLVSLSDTVYEDSVVEGYVEIFDGNLDDSLQVAISGISWLNIAEDSIKSDGTKIFKLKGVPLQEDTGKAVIKFKVADFEGEIDTATFEIIVINTNDAPILSMVSKSVAGGAAEYLMTATDDFDSAFTYYGGITSLSGDTVFIDSNSSGKFSIYPIYDGVYLAHSSVTDMGGLQTSITDTLKISGVNSKVWSANGTWNMVSIPSDSFIIDSVVNREVIQYWDESKPYRNIYQYYNRVNDPSLMSKTASYWIKNDSIDINVSLNVPDTLLTRKNQRSSQSKTIYLNKDSYGWNMISSPYVYPVSWNSDLTLWEWNETTEEYIDAQNIIYPWKGYWVLAENSNDSIVLNDTPNFIGRKKRGINRCSFVSQENWTYNIVLQSEMGSDKENLFGFNQNALDGKDKLDRAEPPRLTNTPYLYFTNPEWQGNLKEYASDIRKNWNGTAIYNVGISNSSSSNKELSVKIEGNHEDHKIFLFVRNEGEIREYNNGDILSVKSSDKDKYFTVFATADRDFLSTIPLTFKANHPYPNPFRSISNIKYTLPYRWENNGLLISKPYHVRIKVYDTKGRVVKEIFNGKQSIGIHRVVWDGKVNGGSLASSGAYFVKVNAGNFKTVKKIMVLK